MMIGMMKMTGKEAYESYNQIVLFRIDCNFDNSLVQNCAHGLE